MKILLVSDTHGNNEILLELVKCYPNMDLYLHAGDSQSDPYSIYPFISIRGNCDSFYFDEKYRVFTPMGYLLMRHYPHFSNDEIANNKFLVNGHTHCVDVYQEEGHVFICPGSPNRPRDNTDGTFIILDIEEKEAEIRILDINTNSICRKYKIS